MSVKVEDYPHYTPEEVENMVEGMRPILFAMMSLVADGHVSVDYATEDMVKLLMGVNKNGVEYGISMATEEGYQS